VLMMRGLVDGDVSADEMGCGIALHWMGWNGMRFEDRAWILRRVGCEEGKEERK
jgi:hypothetical protein